MTAHPDSFPFVLSEPAILIDDYLEEDDVIDAVPSSRNVAPRLPPAPWRLDEDLPTVIVDLREHEADASVEAKRASDVDGLLSVKLDFPAEEARAVPAVRPTAVTLVSATKRSAVAFHLRGVAVALVAAITAAGGTLAGFRALHIVGMPGVAGTHIVR